MTAATRSPAHERFEVINPATEAVIETVSMFSAEETDAAVNRALQVAPAWAGVAPGDRALLLRRFADAVDADIETLARLEIANAGHTVSNARWEAGQVRDVLEYFAAVPERLFGRQIPVAGGVDITFKEPLGVVGVIAPWNFPMPIAAWGLAPALAAGNCVLLKPAEWTPLTALRLQDLARRAGIPEHVFQVLPGEGPVTGARLVAHPAVRKIVFTGSSATGKQILRAAADEIKRVTLELGGKNANIVFADADIERAAAAAPSAVFDNSGQDCCSRSRILVQRAVHDKFLELLEPAVRAYRVGEPSDPDTQMGPLISASHRAKVTSYLEDAPIAFRGDAPEGPGYWVAPTVLAPVERSARQWSDEIFGPVVAVVPFDDEAEAIRLANDTTYGLSGSIWTRDLARALRVSRGLESGNLSVNSNSSVRYWTPFGGFKHSGLGRELGPDAVDAFTETKNVFISTED